MRKSIASMAALALLTGCSAGKDVALVNAGIDDFHHKLNAGDFATIYDNSGADLKGAATKTNMVELFAAIHRKLGNFQSGSSTNWNDTINTNAHTVTVKYAAKYAGGPADEDFVYRIDGGRAVLAGYHVNSMALVVN